MSPRPISRYLGMFTGGRAKRAWAVTQAARLLSGTDVRMDRLAEVADGILAYVEQDETSAE